VVVYLSAAPEYTRNVGLCSNLVLLGASPATVLFVPDFDCFSCVNQVVPSCCAITGPRKLHRMSQNITELSQKLLHASGLIQAVVFRKKHER